MPILSAEERVGRTLDGKYEVGAPIATGGMGVVYRGRHTWTDRPVAIKVLLPGLSEDPEIARRFLTEARASASIRHPNVVDVLDMGRDDDGTLYMVLELLEGRDLGDVMDERGTFTAAEAVAVMAPVLEALAFAHEKGFVHRDMKPSNVYLSLDARGEVVPKVLDFGIAKALDGGANKATRTGVIIGTPHYMAPEQASGVGVIGPASDTWSAGILLYEMLSGRVPFEGASPTMILMSVLNTRAAPVRSVAPSVPAHMAALIDCMLDPDPDARPRDLRAHAKALRDAVGGTSDVVLGELVREQPGARERATAPTVMSTPHPGATDRMERAAPPGAVLPVTRQLSTPARAVPVEPAAVAARAVPVEPAAVAAPAWLPWAIGALVVATFAVAAWWTTSAPTPSASTSASSTTAPSPATAPSSETPSSPPASTSTPASAATVPPTSAPGSPSTPERPSTSASPSSAPPAARPSTSPSPASASPSASTPPAPSAPPTPEPPLSQERPSTPPAPVVVEPAPTMMGPAPITEVEEEW